MILLPIHIIGGLVGIAAGMVAVFASKGQTLHRRSGTVFVYAMLALTATGTVTAITRSQPFIVVAGVLTFYLVLTGLLTVRRPAVGARWIDVGAMLVALAIALTCGVFIGLEMVSSATGERGGGFVVIYVIFGLGAVLAVIGDARTLRARRVAERQRLARHLQRMCFALLIAVGSVFSRPGAGIPRSVALFRPPGTSGAAGGRAHGLLADTRVAHQMAA